VWNKFFLSFLFIIFIPQLSFANMAIIYQGQIDFTKNQFDLVLNRGEKGRLVFKASAGPEGEYDFLLDAQHFKMLFFDISSKIEGSVESKAQGYFGKVRSQYTLVDFQPIRELVGSFDIRNNRISLARFSVGSIECKGYVDLNPPHKLNLVFKLEGMAMDNFLSFWMRDQKMEAEGEVSGTIKVSGDSENIFLKGNLGSLNGRIKELKYDSIYLNAEGVYPHLRIVRSMLSEKEGLTFTLEGPFNLKDTENFRKQVKALTISPLVRDSNSSAEWTIKRFKEEETGMTEIKYFLRKEKGLDSSSDEGSGILGIERMVEF